MPPTHNETLQAKIFDKIAARHNIGYVVTDETLIIQDHNLVIADWTDKNSGQLTGLPLTALFEELAGYEATLALIANNQHDSLTLPPLQRPNASGPIQTLHLTAESFDDNSSQLLLTIIDMTPLAENNTLYSAVVESQTEFVCRFRADGSLTFVNKAYCRTLKKCPEDLIGRSFLTFIVDEDRPYVSGAIDLLSAQNPVITTEYRTMLPSNEIRWQHWTYRASLGEQGQLLECMAIGRDVTRHKQTEQVLQRVRFSIDRVGDSVFWVDNSGSFLDANETATWKLGYEREELLEMKFGDIDPKFTGQDWAELWQEAQHQRVITFESVHYTKEGKVLPVEVIVHNLDFDNTAYVCIFVRDITERKNADQALLESESRFQSIITKLPMILWSIDQDGIITLSEGRRLTLLGLKPGELVGQSAFGVLNANDQRNENIRRALAGEITYSTTRIGDAILETQYIPLQDDEDQITGLIGISSDVTEREQARQFLAYREAYLSTLVELQRRLFIETEVATFYDDVTRLLGPISHSDCVCLAEKQDNAEALSFRPCAVWSQPADRPQPDLLENLAQAMIEIQPNWIEKLDRGEIIFDVIEKIMVVEHFYFYKHGIRTILLVPLRINSSLFGLIAFGNTAETRTWNLSETVLLEAAAAAISLAKEQQLTKKALAETNQQLEQHVQERTADLVKVNETLQIEVAERKRAEELLQKAHDELEIRVVARTGELTILNEKLETLYQVGKEITQQRQLDNLLNSIAKRTAKLLKANSSCILLLDEVGAHLTIEGAYGLHEDIVENTHEPLGHSIAGRVAQTGEPIIANDIPNDPRFDNPAAVKDKFLAIISAPLIVGPKIIGTLDAHSKTHWNAFDEQDLNLLNMLAGQAAIAIENARLYTHLNQAIEELRTANDNLHKAKEQAESANQAKSEFLANMSHELRTPLNGILGFTQILKRDSDLSSQQAEAIDIIHTSGEHLLTMINDILDISKIEAGRLELEPEGFHLASFIKSITEMLRIRAEQKGLQLKIDLSPHLPYGIIADEKRLRQILINLLGNGIKFTKTGQIMLKVDICQPRQPSDITTRIHFEVQDTGVGIPPDKLEEIFAPFHQVKDKRVHSEGTGLGLAISRRLVRMMDSELQVESVIDQGTKFWFEVMVPIADTVDVPFPIRNQKIIGYKPLDAKTLTPFKILVVDDKAETRLAIKELLTPLGFDITEAANGQAAVQQAEKLQPALIIMDLIMPLMDGFEATRRIRRSSRIKDVVILAASAAAFQRSKQRSRTAGCQDNIEKPILVAELFEKIQKYLALEWVYDDENASPRVETVIPEAPLAVPALTALESIRDLALIGDIEGIQTYVKELITAEPDLKPFGSKVNDLANNFALDEIKELISQHLKDLL